jgi:hypothetical protein
MEGVPGSLAGRSSIPRMDGSSRSEKGEVQFPSFSRFRCRLDEIEKGIARPRNHTPFSGVVVHGGAGYHSRTNEIKHRELLEQ